MNRLIIFLAILPLQLFAQVSSEHPVRLRLDVAYGVPLAGFKKGSNDHFVIGQSTDGLGCGVHFLYPVLKNTYAGFGYKGMSYSLDEEMIHRQLFERFDDAGHYTTTDVSLQSLSLHYFGIELTHLFNTKHISIEPCINTGFVFSATPGGAHMNVTLKEQNSNNTEQVEIKNTGKMPLSWYNTFGVRCNKRISNVVMFHFATRYTLAQLLYTFDTYNVDFFDNRQQGPQIITNARVNTLRFEAGIQFLVYRKGNEQPDTVAPVN